ARQARPDFPHAARDLPCGSGPLATPGMTTGTRMAMVPARMTIGRSWRIRRLAAGGRDAVHLRRRASVRRARQQATRRGARFLGYFHSAEHARQLFLPLPGIEAAHGRAGLPVEVGLADLV